ncbi:DNA methyltransferase [Escherichia coli]|uniref:DNA methyltransferase n=1 Tax=Escherichia coli TaxID=562 RepID=UPI000BE1BB9D|nr:DNA methyltransferase [Escherichia coli]
MSRFVLGNCIDVMARIPDNAIDFILTDPPYLVGFRDRQGRTITGDKTDEWLQPACNEMYRVLKKDALMDVLGWKYSGNRHHPTEKPVTSLQPLIESFTHPNAIVLDPFAGSGSTCVAALQSGRRYIGIELLEQYHRAGQQRLAAVQRAMQQGAANDNWFEPEAA